MNLAVWLVPLMFQNSLSYPGTFSAFFVLVKEHKMSTHFLKDCLMWMNLAVLLVLLMLPTGLLTFSLLFRFR